MSGYVPFCKKPFQGGHTMKIQFVGRCCLVMCALLLGWGGQVWGDDQAAEEPVEIPEYQNAAQAAHDENLAAAYFDKVDAEAARLQDELNDLDPDQDGTDPDPATAERIVALNEELDQLAADRGLIEDGEIARMRADGMGWGEIAHELGVHPGVLGLGHGRKNLEIPEDSLALATTTDMQTGNSMGHGNAYRKAGMESGGMSGNAGKMGGKDRSDKGDKGNSGNKGGNGGGKNK